MYALTESDILNLWDHASQQHPLDRALTILQAADPGLERTVAARRTIGARDHNLLRIGEATFGSKMDAVASCPLCAAEVEFQFRSGEIRAAERVNGDSIHELTHDGWRVRFRLPDSQDLAALLQAETAAEPEDLLMSRCVVSAEHVDGTQREIPSTVCNAVSEAMSQLDPQAEIDFLLDCPTCEHQWRAVFDVEDFLWRKIAVAAKRLLAEVDMLARTYHWSEPQILKLGRSRRQAYLELIRS